MPETIHDLVDFIEINDDFNKDKITTEFYHNWIIEQIKYHKQWQKK